VHNSDVFDNGTNPTFTWADSVDLCAQGFNVYSTATVGGTQGASPVYTTSGGTSFAAPQVSGAAALVRSQFPCLSAIETAELLIDNAVDIESIGTNGDFAGKIGKRLDVGAALNIAINPCELVGIAAPQDDLEITVYPNPSAGNATLVVSATDVWNVQVFSARGEQVMQAQFRGNTHHIQGLADGLYLITLSNGKQSHTQRLLVMGNR
jgi:subtilisin family serine protease